MKKKVLVIVAHPDDETLWMGGLLLRNKKNWKTTVICLTRKSDKDRCPKFRKVCKALGVKGCIFDLDDKKLKTLNQKLIIKTILTPIKNKSFDFIFTHNSNGEYGHIRHKEIHKAVKELLNKSVLKSKKVFFFSYHKVKNNFQNYAVYNSNADKLIKLNRDELAMKRNLAIEVYGYNRGGIGFEENSARQIEAFDELR